MQQIMTKKFADTMLKLQFLIGDYRGLIKIVKNRQKFTKLNDSFVFHNLPELQKLSSI